MNLYFPKLIQANDKKETEYKLDWTEFHKLPEPYEQQIQELVFDLNDSYIEELQRVRNNAIHEWGLQRGRFDTMVREWCLEPAITFSQVYFKLLWDCVVDTDLRDSRCPAWSPWLRYALMYKMWQGQTGGCCVFENAGLDELNRWTDNLLTGDDEDSTLSEEQHTILTGLQSFRRVMTKLQEDLYNGVGRKSSMLCSPEGAHIPETYVSPFTGKKS